MGEHADKKSRINTKTFMGGLQAECTHVITGVANIDAYTTFTAEFSDYDESSQPLMTRQYQQLADVYSSAKFSRYMQKYKGKSHFPHYMVTQGQTVWAGLITVAANITW